MQRRFTKPAQQFAVLFRHILVHVQHLLVFHAAQEFDLPKLLRLKSARGFQFVAKGEEVRRQHRFEIS